MDWDLFEHMLKDLAGFPCQVRPLSWGRFAIEMVPNDPGLGWVIADLAGWQEVRPLLFEALRRLLLKRIAGQVAKIARDPGRWHDDDTVVHIEDELRSIR